MNKMQMIIPAVLLSAGFASLSLAQGAPAASTAPTQHQGHAGFRHHGPFAQLLRKLNLSSDQKSQVRQLVAQNRSAQSALRDSVRSNRSALATTSPNDSSYPALVSTAQSNAAAMVQARANLWTQIYGVLTPEQKAQIPGIVAAEQARHAQWQAQHGNS